MKIWPLLITLILLCLIPLLDFGQNCNNWAKISSALSGIQIGDLDITGNQITVEAVFNRTSPYVNDPNGNSFGDIVSDNLKNKQGNAAWDGSIIGDVSIKQSNPTCSSFVANSYNVAVNNVTASFTGPDTACINSPLQLINTSVGASNYYWSFCAADFNATPQAVNLGNPGNLLNTPVFMDYTLDANGNYYGFITSYVTGEITKLDYGNSLLNAPTATDLGNFGGIIPIYAEGIQVKKVNGKCYAFVVAAADNDGIGSVLVRLDFGSSFSNAPTATSLGNIGGLLFPHDLFITAENNNFYGFTINIRNNTITRFDFGNDLGNIPNGVNLGTIGNFNYPCGLSFVNTGGYWYAFVTNRDDNTITRLDFGSSLTNTPTGTNIGNPGNFLNKPRDISIFQSCNGVIGLVVNEDDETTGTITKLDFGSNVLVSPLANDLGNLGSLKFPHSISKFFLEGNDIYSFITNVANNTITRLRYTGCTSTNIASSTQRTPPPVTYTTPGIYNVNLLVDIGLPTQSSFCKQIVVLDCDTVCDMHADFKYAQTTCDPKSVHFQSTTLNADSIWWDFGNGKKAGNIPDTTIQYAAYGNYIVKLFAKTNKKCLDTAAYTIDINIVKDNAIINNDTSICASSSVYLNAIKGLNYCWSPSAGLSNISAQNPVASPAATTKYYLHILTDSSKSVIMDSVLITVLSLPDINVGNDTTLCGNASAQLTASGAASYVWSPAAGLSNPNISNPVASPSVTTTYYVTASGNNSCSTMDSVTITKQPDPVFTLTPQNAAICKEDSVLLTASGGDIFNWTPVETVADPDGESTAVFPITNTTYKVVITNSVCKITDTIYADVSVKELPVITISKSNDVDCINYHAQLTATGGLSYKWSPGTHINNTTIYNPVVNPPADTWYAVEVKGSNNCYNTDSILVKSAYNPADTKFEIATAFTPNHDGLNDCFSVKYWGFADFFDMSIYNRWGELMFHSKNINACWDGTFKGQPQPTGTYIYQISVSSSCTEGVVHKKGTFVLIR